MQIGSPTPILRIFDERKARAFYVDYLGFAVEFEHRFDQDAPLYLGLSRGDCTLHLSEHHGDCTPGSALRIETEDLEAFHRELSGKGYGHQRPGIETMSWGTRDLLVTDPFGNRLIFTESGED